MTRKPLKIPRKYSSKRYAKGGVYSLLDISRRVKGKDSKEKLKLSATIFPLYDILKNVGGDLVDVHLIVPPGASPHIYEFSPKDLGKMK